MSDGLSDSQRHAVALGYAAYRNPFAGRGCGCGPGAHDRVEVEFVDRFGTHSERRRVRTVSDAERARLIEMVEDGKAVLAGPARPCWWRPSGRVRFTPYPTPSREDLERGRPEPNAAELRDAPRRRAESAAALNGPFTPWSSPLVHRPPVAPGREG